MPDEAITRLRSSLLVVATDTECPRDASPREMRSTCVLTPPSVLGGKEGVTWRIFMPVSHLARWLEVRVVSESPFEAVQQPFLGNARRWCGASLMGVQSSSSLWQRFQSRWSPWRVLGLLQCGRNLPRIGCELRGLADD